MEEKIDMLVLRMGQFFAQAIDQDFFTLEEVTPVFAQILSVDDKEAKQRIRERMTPKFFYDKKKFMVEYVATDINGKSLARKVEIEADTYAAAMFIAGKNIPKEWSGIYETVTLDIKQMPNAKLK